MLTSNPAKKSPSHDLILRRLDTGEKIGILFADNEGERKWNAIQRSPYPRQSLQTNQGGSGFSTQEAPYHTITQQDWIGGRGQLKFEADATRFYDSLGLQSWMPGKFFLGGNPTWTSGHMPTLVKSTPGSVTWTRLTGANLYIAVPIRTNIAGSFIPKAMAWLRAVGTPGNLKLSLYSATAAPGNPNAEIAFANVAPTDVVQDQAEAVVKSITTTLSQATWYFLVVANSGTDDASNYWEAGHKTGAATDGRIASDGAAWSNSTIALYHQVWGGAYGVEPSDCLPFMYKGQMYAVVREDDASASYLWMAGDRGAADSNAGDQAKLNDATKAWTVNAWANYIVLIVAGPGSEEVQPWRKILSNTATVLTVDVNWNVAHTTATDYVILSDTWQQLSSLNGHVTDIALAGRYIYFARGSGTSINKWFEANIAGVWTTLEDAEPSVVGDKLLAQQSPDGAEYLWVSNNADDATRISVTRYEVPQGRGPLTHVVAEIAPTDRLWGEYIGSATLTLEPPDILKLASLAGYTLGDKLLSYDLVGPVDLTRGTRAAVTMRSVGTAPVVDYYFSDTKEADKKAQPTRLLYARRTYRLPKAVLTRRSLVPPAIALYSDGTNYYRVSALEGADTHDLFAHAFTTTEFLYLGFIAPINSLPVNIGTANTNASALSVNGWDGNSWQAVTVLVDGTESPAGTSLGQSGTISFADLVRQQKGGGIAATFDASLYWYRFTWAANLSANTSITRIRASNTTRTFVIDEVKAAFLLSDAENSANPWNELEETSKLVMDDFPAGDRLYVCSEDATDEFRIDVVAANSTSGAVTVYAPLDGLWTALTLAGDTTDTGPPLAQDGSITVLLPANVQPLTINGITGYWVYFEWSNAMDAATTIREISVRDQLSFEFIDLDVLRHAEDATIGLRVEFAAGDFLYACGQNRFDALDLNLGATVNNNAATFAVEFADGNDWIGATEGTDTTALAGASLAQSGILPFHTGAVLMQPANVEGLSGYWARVFWSAALDAVLIHSVGLQRNESVSQSFIVSPANDWVSGVVSANLGAASIARGVDRHNIRNVVVIISQNKPTSLEIRGGLGLVRAGGFIVSGFGRQGGVFEIQTEASNEVVPVPLKELSTLAPGDRITGMELYGDGRQNPWVFVGVDLGRVHTTNDTYLYFNLGAHIQRYVDRTLDNVGWTRDEGMPTGRSGRPSFLLSSPGGIYAGLDAGSDGYSAVLFGQSRAWHDLFRAPKGMRVQAACIQAIPGPNLDRLWVSIDGFLMWLPSPSETFDPTRDTSYVYAPEGHLITSWMSASLYSLQKLFTYISLYTEYLTTTGVEMKVFYQTESGSWDRGWTALASLFTTSPVQQQELKAALVLARRIRFRLSLRTNNQAVTPIVFSWFVDLLITFDTKFAYTFQHRYGDADKDKNGVPQKSLVSWQEIRNKLDVWANDRVVCEVESYDPLINGKRVMVQPSGARPIYKNDADGNRAYILETTLLEI